MKRIGLIAMMVFFMCSCALSETQTLKDVFKDDFLIGVALNVDQIFGKTDEKSQQVIKEQFNSTVSENCLKSMFIQPKEGEFYFEEADKYVAYGETNQMFIIGHALVWHSQVPDWIFIDDEGIDVSRGVLIERMRNHIYTLAGRYKGRINGWDVVNEAISDAPEETLRKSKWQQIIGDDYIELAFKFAHEAAPEAELYYNDYNMYDAHKRNVAIQLIRNLQKKGIRIDGVGMQAHYGLDTSLDEVEASIQAFSELGVKVMFTELDVTILPFPTKKATADVSMSAEYKNEYNPYVKGVPEDVEIAQSNFYLDLFTLFLRHSEVISRVTFWGLNDGDSWRNDWPIKGRKDYCLLIDRDNNPKIVFNAIVAIKEKR